MNGTGNGGIVPAFGIDELIAKPWKLTNRAGACSSTTAASINTSRNHGLLICPVAKGGQRMVLLSRVEEVVKIDGCEIELGCAEYPGKIHPRGDQFLREFETSPSPRWVYEGEGWAIEKRFHLLAEQNTVLLTYRSREGSRGIELSLRPLFALRAMGEEMYQWLGKLGAERRSRQDYRLPATGRTPEVFFSSDGAFEGPGYWYYNNVYRGTAEGENGGLEDLWNPGQVKWSLAAGGSAHFACSVEPVRVGDVMESLKREGERRRTVGRAGDEGGADGKSNPDQRTGRPASTAPMEPRSAS